MQVALNCALFFAILLLLVLLLVIHHVELVLVDKVIDLAICCAINAATAIDSDE